MNSLEIVRAFWDDVWNAHDPDAVDRFVVDDIVLVSGGHEIAGKENFKNWIRGFLDKVNDLQIEPIETFQNDDGTRVTSRWVMTGTNNGILSSVADQEPIVVTGIAVFAVGGDGKLLRNWVEQAS